MFALCFCLCALRRACTFPRGAGVVFVFCCGGCCVAGWVVSLGVFCWWCVSLCVPCWLPPLFFAVSPLVLHFLSACHSHCCCHWLLLGCPYSTMDLTAIPMEQLLAELKRRQRPCGVVTLVSQHSSSRQLRSKRRSTHPRCGMPPHMINNHKS